MGDIAWIFAQLKDKLQYSTTTYIVTLLEDLV